MSALVRRAFLAVVLFAVSPLAPTFSLAAEEDEEVGEGPRELRDAYFSLRRAGPKDPAFDAAFDAARARLQAIRDADGAAKRGRSPLLPGAFVNVGPQPIRGGQTPTSNPIRSAVSGRVTAIAVDSAAGAVYVGGAQGGVWKSTDAGLSWVVLTDALPTQAVGALTLDPTPHAAGAATLYLGTGEGNSSADSYAGVGVFKSTDSGATWAGPFGTSSFLNRSINSIVVDRTNRNVVLAGSATGFAGRSATVFPTRPNRAIYRSTDGGSTWTAVTPSNKAVSNIVQDPLSPAVFYAAMIYGTGVDVQDGGVLRSTDSGVTWTQMADGMPGHLPSPSSSARCVVSASAAPGDSVSTLVVGTSETIDSSNGGKIYRSTDGGATFTELTAARGYCGGQCFYDDPVLVEPGNPLVLYHGGAGTSVTSGNAKALFRASTDGGVTFTDRVFSQDASTGLHADVHAIVTDPANPAVVWVGNDGGVWRSTDRAVNWQDRNTNLVLTQFVGLDVHPDEPANAVGGTQDNGTNAWLGSNDWQHISDGDGGLVFFQRTNGQNVVGTRFAQANNLSGVFFSTRGVTSAPGDFDFAGSFKCTGTGCPVNQGITLSDPVLFYPPIALDRGSGAAAETLYYGTNKLYKAPRFFTTAPPAGPTTAVFTALAGAADVTGGGMCGSSPPSLSAIESVANPAAGTDAAILYVGSCSGHVLRSTDGGASFAEVDAGGSTVYVSAIAADPASNGQVVWVARSGYAGSSGKNVRRTTDGGATWASAANGIPDVPVNHVLVDPNDHTRVFAATDIGVYVTTDGGATWTEAAPGIPRVAVWRLAASTLPAGSGELLAATYGRGVYRLSPLGSGSAPALSVSPSSLDFGSVTLSSSADRTLTVANTGSGNLVGSASVAAPFSVVSGGSFNLSGGQTQSVTVRFTPAAAGFASSSVAFSSNGGSASVSVSGTGVSMPSSGGATVVVPVVLSVAGLNNSFFTSEMTLTNRAAVDTAVELLYTAAFGGGSGAGVDFLGAGRQKIVPDAMAYLRSLGVPIPSSGNVGGTLRVRFRDVPAADPGAVTVRTATTVPEGRAGLAYSGLSATGLLTGTAYLCGLRQNATDRSNVAVINAGAPGDGDVVLRLTVFSGDPSAPISGTLPDISLSPGGFSQISGVLQSNGLVLSNGYVKVERVSGNAPYFAYGVINDQANSDGSFVVPFPENALAGRTGLTLPVVVEAGAFSTELVLANTGSSTRTVQLTFVADAVNSSGNAATLSRTLLPHEQQILPDFVKTMRSLGVTGIGPAGATFAGALFLNVTSGDAAGLFLGARTSSPGGGGRYGLFYTGVPYGSAATSSAWLYGLQQTASDRTNLALVNTGETDGSTDVFRIDLYDGSSGALAKTIDGTALGPRKWTQITTVLSQYAPGTSNAYARVTRTAGGNPFVVYAVVNDGAAPGQRSGDGAFVSMDAGPPSAPSGSVLEVLPPALDFGGVLVGSSRDLSLTVRNKGTGTLVGSVSADPPFSVVSGAGFSLGAGASQAVTIRFAPASAGAASVAASVISNGGNASVPLSGTGTSASAPAIDVTPTSLDFGSVGVGQTKDLTFTVRSIGSATLTVSSLAVGGAFSVPSPATPFSVPPGATQSVTVRFAPTSAGGQSATLTASSNDPARSSVTVSLQGQGTSGGTTEELGTDDGSLEGGAVGDGLLVVNRLTPTRYPATLKTIRAFFTTFEGLPSPVGATIRLVAFADPNAIGEPMSNPTKLVDASVIVPPYQGDGSYVDFTITNGPTITKGDLYVGFMSPNPYGGVAFVLDTNGDQKRRGFYSFDQGGTFSLLKVPNSVGQPKDVNVAIHAVVSSP